MGLSCQATENAQLREHFKMRPGLTGVLISKISPLSDAYKVLKKDDILLTLDGTPIANDGTGREFWSLFFFAKMWKNIISSREPIPSLERVIKAML